MSREMWWRGSLQLERIWLPRCGRAGRSIKGQVAPLAMWVLSMVGQWLGVARSLYLICVQVQPIIPSRKPTELSHSLTPDSHSALIPLLAAAYSRYARTDNDLDFSHLACDSAPRTLLHSFQNYDTDIVIMM